MSCYWKVFKRNMIIPNVCAILFLLAVFSQASHSTEMTEEKHPSRMKRQSYTNNDVGNAFIDSVFNIPISTLNAVGQLIKNSRPVVQEVRRRAEQQYSQYQENRRRTSTTVQYIDLRRTTPRPRRRTAAELAAIRPAYDGSAYRI
ncbi:uncharacterized protein LOC111060349 isoform X2 [Nilaparvata lugens]|uniref:uncharacterized protein LOC111054635 isoform X2 n=1 Tax=Nilaparvata lugens TaxID=108931 RepID=UPI00193C988F|nr:uncharacterized protein LOC111054635 isoform X2 [Nilaparvata lugens]XP_039279010.1 uncharacterized protein LOC111060349 isoform X2 [Nilaparvata lugens]